MKSILIVDDDSINCLLAKHALAQDYRALAVKSGKDALAFLENTIPIRPTDMQRLCAR